MAKKGCTVGLQASYVVRFEIFVDCFI